MDDEEWDRLTPDEQDAYNDRIDAEDELSEAKEKYDTSMSLGGPALLGILGIVFGGIFFPAFLIIVLAIVWALMRIVARSQAYQRYKDARENLKSITQSD
jgi:hypothetical protein